MFTNLLGWLVTAPKIAGISRNWLLNLVHHTISPFQGTSFFDGTFQGTSESSNLNHPIKLPRLYMFLLCSQWPEDRFPFFNFSIYAGKQRWPVCKVWRSHTEDYLIYLRSFATCLGFTASLLLGFLPLFSNITEGVKKVVYLNFLLMGSVIRLLKFG